MKIKYEVRDLLSVPQGYYLAHNISADCSFESTVASQIQEAFNIKYWVENTMFALDLFVGNVVLDANVFNLITKENRRCSVDLANFRHAVVDLANGCRETGLRKLAIAKLSTDEDGLDWGDVLEIFKEAFEDIDIDILVCVLSEDDIPDDEDETNEPDEEINV